MAIPGFRSVVLRAGQTSTPFVNSIAGSLPGVPFGAGFQINNVPNRLLDPSVSPVVEIDEGAGWVAPAPGRATVDFLFGIIRFSPALTLLNCRVSGSALNLLPIFEVSEHSLTLSRSILDTTNYDSGDAKTKLSGLMDAKGEIKAYELFRKDPVVDGDLGPSDLIDSGEKFLFSIQAGTATPKLTTRLWARISDVMQSGNADDKTTHTLQFNGSSLRVGASYSRFVD